MLLDINGTMCERNKKRLDGDLKYTFKHKYHYIYKRPGLEDFLDFLSDNQAFDVYIYTSIMRHNADPLLQKLLPGYDHITSRLFDRTMNKHDPDGLHHFDTVRDLPKVWEQLTQYGPETTIMVDNEIRKCVDYHQNTVILPAFIDADSNMCSEDSLLKLQKYLKSLVVENVADVRNFIGKHSFTDFDADDEVHQDDEGVDNKQRKPFRNSTKLSNQKSGSIVSKADSLAENSEFERSLLSEHEEDEFALSNSVFDEEVDLEDKFYLENPGLD